MAGLYVHVPFCTQRCVYCDFYFVTTQKSHAGYVQALVHEIEHYGYEYGSREPIETIYFGGGTPSLLHPDHLWRLVNAIHDTFDTDGVIETTLELNPEDVDEDRLRAIRSMGFDRLSIGIQSFFEDDLRFMNRSHTAEQAEAIVPMARAAGFENFSADLIFGIPEQPLEYWGANVQKAIRLGVPHVSAYNLEIMERTPLYKQVERGLVTPTDDDTMHERYELAMQLFGAAGYDQYEISSFAREGRRAVHNQNYWAHKNYVGLGPSAHSFWWRGLPAQRWSNLRNLRQYEALLLQRTLPLDLQETLGLDSLAEEYIMLRLRTSDGLDLGYLEAQYGVDLIYEKGTDLIRLEDEGLIEPVDGVVRLTDAGKMVCDAITAQLAVFD